MSSSCATLSGSLGGGAWCGSSCLALRALASASSRALRASRAVSRGGASVAAGANVPLRRRVLVSRKSCRAASRAVAAFQSGWPGASAEALRANPCHAWLTAIHLQFNRTAVIGHINCRSRRQTSAALCMNIALISEHASPLATPGGVGRNRFAAAARAGVAQVSPSNFTCSRSIPVWLARCIC